MNLALFPPSGGGLRTLAQAGQLARLVDYYLPAYAEAFAQLYYFSYLNERAEEYAGASAIANLHLIPNESSQSRLLYSLSLVQRQRAVLANCHISRVFQASGILPAWQAKQRWQVPIVVTYGYRYAEFARTEGRHFAYSYLRVLEGIALRNADAVIVTTEELAGYVQKFVQREAIAIIPNGVDTTLFKPALVAPNLEDPVILFVGRFTPQKNLGCLVEAVARVQAKRQRPLRLELIGDGPLRQELATQAQALGVEIVFRGIVAQGELPEFYQKANLFVLPSHLEGHPKVLLEAMACGLPVVASDAPGNRTLVEHERNGLLFPINDAEALAARIEQLLDAPGYAAELGNQARKSIVEHYDLRKMLAVEVDLIRRMIRRLH